MKLNHDCIRDILLFTEDLPPDEVAIDDQIYESDRLKKYSKDEIIYAITRLGDNDAKLIKGYVKISGDVPYITCISSLTFEGHKYLDNIRDSKVWSESKKISSKLSSVSIDVMVNIASKVMLKMLNLE